MISQDNRDNSSVNSGAVNRRHILLASTTLGIASALGSTAVMQITRAQAQTTQGGAETPITEQEAHAIGVDAYLYFYPLITMDVTRKQSTNIEPGKEIAKRPMNMFVNVPTYPPADMRLVVRPNFDTLYSVAWLDLTKEPMIVSVPDTNGRYYLLPMLDMWTDVFASPGWRTTGTQAGNFLITPPGGPGPLLGLKRTWRRRAFDVRIRPKADIRAHGAKPRTCIGFAIVVDRRRGRHEATRWKRETAKAARGWGQAPQGANRSRIDCRPAKAA